MPALSVLRLQGFLPTGGRRAPGPAPLGRWRGRSRNIRHWPFPGAAGSDSSCFRSGWRWACCYAVCGAALSAFRYFCKNHDPGRWLDGPKCTQCGAAYGVAAGPPPTRPKAGTVRTGGTRKRPVSDAPAPAAPPPKKRGPWGSRPAPSEEIAVSEELIARARAVERLRRMLGGAGYSRPVPDSSDYTYGPSAPRLAGGCFRSSCCSCFSSSCFHCLAQISER